MIGFRSCIIRVGEWSGAEWSEEVPLYVVFTVSLTAKYPDGVDVGVGVDLFFYGK